MEQLSHALHAATADPPPSSIDLDQIIAGQGRRVRLQSRAGAIAAVGVLGAVAMTVPSLLATHQGGRTSVAGGPSGTCVINVPPSVRPAPSGWSGHPAGPSVLPGRPDAPVSSENPPSPGNGYVSASAMPDDGGVSGSAMPPVVDTSPTNVPQPTEGCAAAELRLSQDVIRALRQDLPAAQITLPNGRTSMFVRFQGQAGYLAYATIHTGTATFDLNGMLDAELPGSGFTCDSPIVTGRQCTTDPDGTVVIMSVAPGTSDDPMSTIIESVIVQRADGTRSDLYLSPSNHQAAVTWPLTVDQLADLGRTLTLFP